MKSQELKVSKQHIHIMLYIVFMSVQSKLSQFIVTKDLRFRMPKALRRLFLIQIRGKLLMLF